MRLRTGAEPAGRAKGLLYTPPEVSRRPQLGPLSDSTPPGPAGRVYVDGKFFRLGQAKWYPRGLTYGPFAPNTEGHSLPEKDQVYRDLLQISQLGANALRLYHPPPRWFLDLALERELRVLVDIPWQKHRCFLDDWAAAQEAQARVRHVAQTLGGHPAVFAISVANEIPKDIVRYQGAARVARFIDGLINVVKHEAPDCLATYTNYPSTEFLCPTRLDFYSANVYLDDPEVLGRYLDRLQHVAASCPLVLGEYGLDSYRHGEEAQARILAAHVEQVYRRGLAGTFVFAYTDDWFTGGHVIEDWA